MFEWRAWRKPQFCSLACANRGRVRQRSPEKERRNHRVLELHVEGLDAFRIAARIKLEMGLEIATGTVRTIVFRAPKAIKQVVVGARAN